jgi:RNA polymerase sigma factor (sigma-70 family)
MRWVSGGVTEEQADQQTGAAQRRGRAAAAVDERAWEALVGQHTPALWSLARSYGLDRTEAAEAVQTTWLWLVQRLDRAADPATLTVTLLPRLRQECLRVLRERRPETAEPAGDPAACPSGGDRAAALWHAYQRLPERCRQLLGLRAGGVLSPAELAAAVGAPAGSIAPTMQRCLDHLRAQLADPERATGRPDRAE